MAHSAVSDSQQAAISFGLRKGQKSFRRVSLDSMKGTATCPDWARDARVDWQDGWANFPELQLRLSYDPLARAGVCAAKPEDLKPAFHRVEVKGRTAAYIGDAEGMCSVHYHSGKVARREESVWLCTSKQDGYGGSSFFIRMASDSSFHPGEVIELRGPWHGGAPEGYIEVHCHLDNAERDEQQRKWRGRDSMAHLGPDRCKWWHLGLTFGWYVEQSTFFAIVAEKMPHLEWALVDHGNWLRLEPIDPRTNCPKGFTPEQEVK